MRIQRLFQLALASALTVVVVSPRSEAGVVLSAEAPGVQASTVAGVTTETFDGFAVGNYSSGLVTAIGTFDSAHIRSADVFGGANGTNYFTPFGSGRNATSTLTLTAPQGYFGFWSSAADASNTINFYSSGVLIATFDPTTALGALTDPAYLGNPNNGGDSGEKFAYLNVTGTNGTTFDTISFQSAGFESDNYSIRALAPTTPPGTIIGDISTVPEPSTMLSAGIGVVIVLGSLIRRHKRIA